jgi:hypothetical protein
VNHSVRPSTIPGHFAIGVYITPSKAKLIIAEIYGPSANDDTESHRFYEEVRATINELQNTFQTRNLILAGDFNAVLSLEDSSSEHITKKRTTDLLREFMADQHLIDLAERTNKKQHTWYRRNNNQVSSRLDLILTNLPVTQPEYNTKITIFDHAWIQASFGQKREMTVPSMKDFILGSEEFLIRFYDLLERQLETCTPTDEGGTLSQGRGLSRSPDTSLSMSGNSSVFGSSETHSLQDRMEEEPDEDHETARQPIDEGLTAHNPRTGRTDLHFTNGLIKEMTSLHSTLEKEAKLRKEKKLMDVSKRLYFLHKKITNNKNDALMRTQDQDEYNELQRELRMDAEILEMAKQMRIQNFYKSKNGKLNSVSFHSVKEKQAPSTISQLQHDNEIITDPDRIILIMQDWYGHTANLAQEQTERLLTSYLIWK